jgi:hypothetical protein
VRPVPAVVLAVDAEDVLKMATLLSRALAGTAAEESVLTGIGTVASHELLPHSYMNSRTTDAASLLPTAACNTHEPARRSPCSPPRGAPAALPRLCGAAPRRAKRFSTAARVASRSRERSTINVGELKCVDRTATEARSLVLDLRISQIAPR